MSLFCGCIVRALTVVAATLIASATAATAATVADVGPAAARAVCVGQVGIAAASGVDRKVPLRSSTCMWRIAPLPTEPNGQGVGTVNMLHIGVRTATWPADQGPDHASAARRRPPGCTARSDPGCSIVASAGALQVEPADPWCHLPVVPNHSRPDTLGRPLSAPGRLQ